MRSAFPSRARLVRPEVPFPAAIVVRAIPGTTLQVGDVFPDPGEDKRARMRAALYVEQRRLAPATEPSAATAAKSKKEKKNHGIRET